MKPQYVCTCSICNTPFHPVPILYIQLYSVNEYEIPNPSGTHYWQPSLVDSEIYGYMERNQFAILQPSSVTIKDVIGEGEFGLVCKGECKMGDEFVEVAVKRAKEDDTETNTTKLLQEAAILGQFHHKNVLKLIGVVKYEQVDKVRIDILFTCVCIILCN